MAAAVGVMLAGGCGDDAAGTGGAGTAASTATVSTASGGDTAGSGGSGGASPQDCTGTLTDDPRLSAALDLLRDRVAADGASAGAIAIVRDGAIVGLGVVGSKQLGSCDPVTLDTLFNVGFQSQIVTNLAVLDAIEDGLISLDSPVADVIATLRGDIDAGDADALQVRHLLTNTGMLRSTSDRLQDHSTCGELVDAVGDDAILQATPGSMQDSSDRSNSELSGLALQLADGRPFPEAVRARVLDPLDMGGTYDADELAASDHATGYQNGLADPQHPECRNRHPSHGYNASITDAGKLLAYVTGGEGNVLAPATRDALLAPQGVHFFSDTYSSFGLQGGYAAASIDDEIHWSGSYSHGFNENLHYLARRDLGVVVLMNSREAQTHLVAVGVLAIYDETAIVPEVVYTPEADALSEYLGTYVDPIGFDGETESTLEIALDDGTTSGLAAVLTLPDGTQLDIAVERGCCPDNFLVPAVPVLGHARFWRDAGGDVFAVQVLGDNGPPFFRGP